MTDYKATSDQWNQVQKCADVVGSSDCSAILELRARIEALEAVQQPHQDKMDRLIALDADDGDPIVMPSSPADSLIDRVAKAIYDALNNAEGWRSEARAAILEAVAALIDWHNSDQVVHTAWEAAKWLEREANQ
jgi:hypothetical protein